MALGIQKCQCGHPRCDVHWLMDPAGMIPVAGREDRVLDQHHARYFQDESAVCYSEARRSDEPLIASLLQGVAALNAAVARHYLDRVLAQRAAS